MTANSPHQSHHAPQQTGYNPITLDDVAQRSQTLCGEYFDELQAPIARYFAAPLLFLIFLFSRRTPLVAPLALVVLLGCLFATMDKRTRDIAAAPLTLAAIKLGFQMAALLNTAPSYTMSIPGFSTDPGYLWLPMFFSSCLVFIPRRDSVTFKIILTGSCLLLASGLLPGQGFVAIFYMLDISLFIAVVVGIGLDLTSHLPDRLRTSVPQTQ